MDIGSQAAWSVSSSKPNYGLHHLCDPDLSTLWQSEGPQPHLINIQFSKKQSISVSFPSNPLLFSQAHSVRLQHIEIFADVGKDDSYTPQRISIRAGTYHGDLHEVRLVDMISPTGWQQFKLGGEGDEEVEPIRAHLLQIAIISNHLNGKDTHVRGVRVFAPKQPRVVDGLIPFTSAPFQQHETIR